jgi:hypothetical protein
MERLRRPLVWVKWLDSANPSSSDWQSVAEWRGFDSLECVSVGYLIAKDTQTVTLAAHLAYTSGDHTKACGIMVIPAGCIRSMKRLAASSTVTRRVRP